jgi:hypothetical protein
VTALRRAAGALLLAGALAGCGPFADAGAGIRNAPACHEDEPCWDCSTMGNRTCGPRP